VLGLAGVGIFYAQQKNKAPVLAPVPAGEPMATNTLEANSAKARRVTLESQKKVSNTKTQKSNDQNAPCLYSSPDINDVATPIPSGESSAFKDIPCLDGHWVVFGDWIDKTGKWGPDGLGEYAHIKYDYSGTIIDEFFVNGQGEVIPADLGK
jgi:hypothetical protein